LNMIAHGRYICRPQNPRCQECALKHLCEYFQRNWATGKKATKPVESG
jgi:endonuclease-3